jgi:hypothetical protein
MMASASTFLADGSGRNFTFDGRVALGDCSPRAPTDPDMQISRIRLFDLRIRCARIDTVNDAGGQ